MINNIKDYLEKRISKKIDEFCSCANLTTSMIKGINIEDISYSNIEAIVASYKSLAETSELLEIYTSNFKNEKMENAKKECIKYISAIEIALHESLKYKLSQ